MINFIELVLFSIFTDIDWKVCNL